MQTIRKSQLLLGMMTCSLIPASAASISVPLRLFIIINNCARIGGKLRAGNSSRIRSGIIGIFRGYSQFGSIRRFSVSSRLFFDSFSLAFSFADLGFTGFFFCFCCEDVPVISAMSSLPYSSSPVFVCPGKTITLHRWAAVGGRRLPARPFSTRAILGMWFM